MKWGLRRGKTERTIDSTFLKVALCNVATAFEKELTLPIPFIFQSLGDVGELTAIQVVQHDYVCASVDGLVGLRLGLDFYFQEKCEAAHPTGVLDGSRDRSWDVVDYGQSFGWSRGSWTHQRTICGYL